MLTVEKVMINLNPWTNLKLWLKCTLCYHMYDMYHMYAPRNVDNEIITISRIQWQFLYRKEVKKL